MNIGLALAMVDRLLGGTGEPPGAPRPLTEIEQTLLRNLITRLLDDYAGTWRPLVRFTPNLETMVCNNIFAHVALPSEAVCLGRFEIGMGGTQDRFTICLPAQAMESVFVRLDLQAWLSSGHAVSDQPDEIKERLGQVRLRLRVPLGGATLSVRDLLGLEAGDVVCLDTRTASELPILVGDRLKFVGKPGMVDGRMGIQIRREAQPGEEA
jgi:flagellar motor switch protein FliM